MVSNDVSDVGGSKIVIISPKMKILVSPESLGLELCHIFGLGRFHAMSYEIQPPQ